MAEENKPVRKLLGALVAGAAMGASIALLFSPTRGRELRARIRESATVIKERIDKQRAGALEEQTASEPSKTLLSYRRRSSEFDAVIIGGGHNGLTAAAYLAKAGHSVLLVERRKIVGGAAVTEELIPGYRFSSLADDSGTLAAAVYDELDLGRHGLKFQKVDPLIYTPLPDGTGLSVWQDIERTADEIRIFSPGDAASYPGFVRQMGKYTRFVAELQAITPPDLPEIGVRDLLELRSAAGSFRDLGWSDISKALRVLPMPVADLLNEWFESDMVKGVLAASALKNISLGPREAGTVYMLLHNWSGSGDGQVVSGKFAAGGAGALSQALASAAAGYGAEIRMGSEAVKIHTENGRAVGIELLSGEKISAAAVVSAVDLRTTFLKLIDPYYLDRSFVQKVSNVKYRGTMSRIHFALDRLPSFQSVNGDAETLLSGRIQIAPSMTYLQKAYDPVKYGRSSQKPYLEIQIPSLRDPSRAPEGKHLMSVSVKYTPYFLRGESWNETGGKLAHRVIDTIGEYAPDFSECVQEFQIITPLDMETIYGLPEGNLSHGEMTLDQIMWMRPVPDCAQYRAPIADLYMCSAATHPGGGITGNNGRNAAREILKDWK